MQDELVAIRLQELQATNAALRAEISDLRRYREKLEDDTDWLLGALKLHEETVRQLTAEKKNLESENQVLRNRLRNAEAVLKRVERSVGYRVFRPLRKVKAMMGSLGIMGRPRTD